MLSYFKIFTLMQPWFAKFALMALPKLDSKKCRIKLTHFDPKPVTPPLPKKLWRCKICTTPHTMEEVVLVAITLPLRTVFA